MSIDLTHLKLIPSLTFSRDYQLKNIYLNSEYIGDIEAYFLTNEELSDLKTWFTYHSSHSYQGTSPLYELFSGIDFTESSPLKGLAHLKDLYIHPDYQNQGIGTYLMNQFEETAIQRGIHHLYLQPCPTHQTLDYFSIDFQHNLNRLLHFYQTLGYSPITLKHPHLFPYYEKTLSL